MSIENNIKETKYESPYLNALEVLKHPIKEIAFFYFFGYSVIEGIGIITMLPEKITHSVVELFSIIIGVFFLRPLSEYCKKVKFYKKIDAEWSNLFKTKKERVKSYEITFCWTSYYNRIFQKRPLRISVVETRLGRFYSCEGDYEDEITHAQHKKYHNHETFETIYPSITKLADQIFNQILYEGQVTANLDESSEFLNLDSDVIFIQNYKKGSNTRIYKIHKKIMNYIAAEAKRKERERARTQENYKKQNYQKREEKHQHPVDKSFLYFGFNYRAEFTVIQKEYKIMAKKHHPDLGGSVEKMSMVNFHYECIRKFYNK